MNKILPIVLGILNLVLLVLIIRGPAQDTAVKTEPTPAATARPAATATPTAKPTPTLEPTPKAANMAGTYRLTGMISDGEEYDEDDMDMLAELDMVALLYLRADGTAAMDLFGEQEELTWEDGALIAEDVRLPFTWEDGVLTMEQDGNVLLFTKISDETEPAAAPSAEPTPEPTQAPTSPWSDVGRPALSDFGWYFEDPTPSGAERMTSPADISGRWKGMNLYYDGGQIYARELLNVDIQAEDGSADVVYDWFYFYEDNGESFDENDLEDTTFLCSISGNGSLYGGSDYGTLDVSVFYRYYGAEYGVGTLTLPDGSVVQLALVRP